VISIVSAKIAADGTISVDYKLVDPNGAPPGPHNTLQSVLATTSTYDILKGVQPVTLKQHEVSTGSSACDYFTIDESGSGTFAWPLKIDPIDTSVQ
jgi:hypothetical protein